MRTKQEILDMIPGGERCRNPRMRQLYGILSCGVVADSELPIFEKEIAAYRVNFDLAEKKRKRFIQEAAKYLA